MRTARHILGMATVAAMLTLPGLAQGAPKPPAVNCTFSQGIWTCRDGDSQGGQTILSQREVPVGAYGDCTNIFGTVGTPTVTESTFQTYTFVNYAKYRANGRLIGYETVYDYDPTIYVENSETYCREPD